MKRFGKPCTWMPCRLRMPSAQCSESVTPSRPIVSKPERRAYSVPTSKPEAKIEAVELVVHAADPDAGLVDALDALAVGVDQVGAGLVVGLEVLVVEARALAQLAVPGLERLGRLRVGDDGVDPGPDLGHLLVVAVLERLARTVSGVNSVRACPSRR